MKTSKAYFEKFKAEFLKWQKELGLTQYRIDFFHENLEDSFAQVTVNELGKVACVKLCTKLSKDDVKCDRGPESNARHEVLHLLTNRLRWLGSCRYIETADLDEEWEAVVVRLEKVLK
ncbi:MAG TPA: hypothetical protein VMY06_14670 [Sedimentisphaerales bacterium]|nr:hypothetical protein [Sedimentisphaerales bacterium]HUU15615.1 hypothetical protein [Sedimentisphaerales bacterium]